MHIVRWVRIEDGPALRMSSLGSPNGPGAFPSSSPSPILILYGVSMLIIVLVNLALVTGS